MRAKIEERRALLCVCVRVCISVCISVCGVVHATASSGFLLSWGTLPLIRGSVLSFPVGNNHAHSYMMTNQYSKSAHTGTQTAPK